LGRRGWWLRICITGLYPRRFGPFKTSKEAVSVLDRFMDSAIMDALCEAQNQTASWNQYTVVEDDQVRVQTRALPARSACRRSTRRFKPTGNPKNSKRKG